MKMLININLKKIKHKNTKILEKIKTKLIIKKRYITKSKYRKFQLILPRRRAKFRNQIQRKSLN